MGRHQPLKAPAPTVATIGGGSPLGAITGIAIGLAPCGRVTVAVRDESGKEAVFPAVVRLNSAMERDHYRHGGILQRVLRHFMGRQMEEGVVSGRDTSSRAAARC
jgi:hypothetical protein